MAYELKMPQLGLTMEEGTVAAWLKKEGDAVRIGDAVAEIATDKLTNVIVSEAEGVLLRCVAQEEEDVPVGGTLAWIGTPGEAIPGGASAPKAAEAAPAGAAEPAGAKKVIVIGGGPGGYVAAIRLAQLGAEVTVVEREHLGGTCLNIGCIPTKCLLHSAELTEDIRKQGSEIGIRVSGLTIDFPQVIAHKNAVSKKLTSGIAGLLRSNHIATLEGEARFLAPGVVLVRGKDGSERKLSADAIIVAVGSVNAAPPIPGIDGEHVIDSTGALSLDALPESMVVIGGGVIGLELACAYAAFGTRITVVEALDHMLPMLDGDLTKIGVEHMKRMGIAFRLSTKVVGIESCGKDGARVRVQTPDGGEEILCGDKVLVATGRRANTEALDLAAGKLDNDRGRIVVNDKMETSVPGVYAVGDCVKGYAQLAHTASAMGETAAENIMGVEAHYDQTTNPTCVYIEPEAASVGLTEEQCRAQGIACQIGKFPMAANGKALILNGGEGLVKIIAGKEFGEILGMHIIGPRATDLIAEGALAIGGEMTLDEIIAVIHSHPTVTEAVREAALHAEHRAVHTTNR